MWLYMIHCLARKCTPNFGKTKYPDTVRLAVPRMLEATYGSSYFMMPSSIALICKAIILEK